MQPWALLRNPFGIQPRRTVLNDAGKEQGKPALSHDLTTLARIIHTLIRFVADK